MGLFDKQNETFAAGMYENDIKKYLKKKNGKTHVLMIESYAKIVNVSISADDKYTTQIDSVLEKMQDDGYDIIDVKINSSVNTGALGNQSILTLITYK